MCSAKEAVILLLSWSTLYVAFSKCIVYWFYISHLDLPLITQNASEKVSFLLNWRCSAKETVILLLSWSARYILFSKCIVSWIYFFSLDLPLFTEDAFVTVNFSLNFICSGKEAVIFLLSWSTLYIAISECIASWFYFFKFWFVTTYSKFMHKSHLFLKYYVLQERSSGIASFLEHTEYSIFQNKYFPDSTFSILICHYYIKMLT